MNSEHRPSQRRPKQKVPPKDSVQTPSEQRKVKKRRVVSKVRSRQKLRLRGLITTIAAIAALCGAAGLIVGGANLGVQLIVNPDAVSWVNHLLPEWTRIPIAVKQPPQTLSQIRDGISKKGLIAGETIFLNGEANTSDLLLTVLSQRPNCQVDCQQIAELRVYQPEEPKGEDIRYRLASQVAIAGPEESFVVAPLNDNEASNRISSRSLPLTQLSRFEGKVPEPGIWLNLTGKLETGKPVAYGQVIHYNPATAYLSVMVSWTSPPGLIPYWQDAIAGDTPAMVVNQTIGLEPQFRVYQIKGRNFVPDPVQLEEVSLNEPALNIPAYRNALLLAKNGLWSPALDLLQSVKSKQWSESAQAQMDVIRLHAQVSKEQSKKTWASPSQQVLVNLIDGRWGEAINVFQIADANQRNEIATLLKTDSGRLWKRIEVAMKVSPAQSDVQAWGALILAAKEGRPVAIAWLSHQPQSTIETVAKINELLDRLDGKVTNSSPVTSHLSQIIGSASPVVTQVNPADWLQPDAVAGSPTPPLQLEKQKVWYQVQISSFHDGQRWRQQPFADVSLSAFAPGKQLWKLLGLDTDPLIKITLWKPDGSRGFTVARVKAAQLKNGVIQLLAAGEPILGTASTKNKPNQNSKSSGTNMLAHTDKAFQLLESNPIAITELSQMQPQWVNLFLPTLWFELQTARLVPPGSIPSSEVMLKSVGNLPVQSIDLTGNNQPEAVVTLYPGMTLPQVGGDSKKPGFKSSQVSKRRTMIFLDTGATIYSEFTANKGEAIAAIADLGDGSSPALVVEAGNYKLKRWSTERQRFE